jgi:hypothetical protein
MNEEFGFNIWFIADIGIKFSNPVLCPSGYVLQHVKMKVSVAGSEPGSLSFRICPSLNEIMVYRLATVN